MSYTAILFVTTVISLGLSDEVTINNPIKTVSSTEMMLEIITDNAWESTYVGDLLMDEQMTLIDSIEAPTEPPSQYFTDDDWDPDYTENTVAPTEMPSESIMDDDWDPTFNVAELLMDEKRMLQLIDGNQTNTQTIEITSSVCSEDCENTAENAGNNPLVARAFRDSVSQTTTTTLRSLDFDQGACGVCESERFLDEENPGTSQSAILVITITLDEEIPAEGVTEAIVESPSFAIAKDTVEVATQGEVVNVVVAVTPITQEPTASPTQGPTTEPSTKAPSTKEPTNQPTKQKKTKAPKRNKTRAPTESPTKEPTKRPKRPKTKSSKSF